MDNLAIHVHGVCVCDARKNERCVRVSDTERFGSCLQSLSTQLYYVLVMMLSDQALEIVRNSPAGVWCRSVAQVALGVRTWRWYQVRSNVAISVEETVR